MGKFYFWYEGPDPEEWYQGNRIYLGVRGLDGLPLEGDPFGDDIDVALEAFGDAGQWLSRLNRITLSQDASLLWWAESISGEVTAISAVTLPDKTPIKWGPSEDRWDAEGDVFAHLPYMVSPSLDAPKKLVGILLVEWGWQDYELFLSTISVEGGTFESSATPVGETTTLEPHLPAIRKDGGALFGIPSQGGQVVSLLGGEGAVLASIVTEGVPAILLQFLGVVHTPEGTEFALFADFDTPPASPEDESIQIVWAPLDGGTHSLSALHTSILEKFGLANGGGRTSSSGAMGVPMQTIPLSGPMVMGWQFVVIHPDGQTQIVALDVPEDAGVYLSAWDAQQNHWVLWYDVPDPDAPLDQDGFPGRRLGGALFLDGDDLSVKQEITEFYPLIQDSRPKGLWYVPSEGPAVDTCAPFWTEFHNTEEVLDCPDEAPGALGVVPFMFPAHLSDDVGDEIVWGSPGATPTWGSPGARVVSTDVGQGVVVCHQETTMSIGLDEISLIVRHNSFPFDPAEGITSESPLQVSGSDTGVFSISAEDAFISYRHHHGVIHTITKEGLRDLLQLFDQEGEDVGLTYNKYVVTRNDNYYLDGVPTTVWDVSYAEMNMYLYADVLVVLSDGFETLDSVRVTNIVGAFPEINSATDLATLFLDEGGQITIPDEGLIQFLGFSALDDDIGSLPPASEDYSIDWRRVATMAPGPQKIGDKLLTPEEAVALLPPGANVTAQDVTDCRTTTVLHSLGSGYRRPDGNGYLESVIVGDVWPGYWVYRGVELGPEY